MKKSLLTSLRGEALVLMKQSHNYFKIRQGLFFLFVFLFLTLEVKALDYPQNLKTFLRSKYPKAVFKIDNSFVYNNQTYLPLVPLSTKSVKKVEIIYSLEDANKNPPRFLLLSNGWAYVRLLKQKDETFTILNTAEISPDYRSEFLKLKFPNDLVVPKDFILKKNTAFLAGKLPIKIEDAEQNKKSNPFYGISDYVYLTSPDTGKIIYFDLRDISKIFHHQTNGAPYEGDYNKKNKTIYITDFAKDKIYEFMAFESKGLSDFTLPVMSNPAAIKVSDDASKAYILNSLSNEFTSYSLTDKKSLLNIKLFPNPTSFTLLKRTNLILVTCPTTNTLTLFNADDFSKRKDIMLEGGPEKIISYVDDETAYITSRNQSSIFKFNSITKAVEKTIPVGLVPTSLAISKDGKWLYVANGKSNTISIIDLNKEVVVDDVELPIETQFPGDIALFGNDRWLIVTSETTNTISFIDLNTRSVIMKLDVGATTHGVIVIGGKNGE